MKLKETLSTTSIIAVELAKCSSDSDSSEHDYVNVYDSIVTSDDNSDSDGPEEEV